MSEFVPARDTLSHIAYSPRWAFVLAAHPACAQNSLAQYYACEIDSLLRVHKHSHVLVGTAGGLSRCVSYCAAPLRKIAFCQAKLDNLAGGPDGEGAYVLL